MTSEPVAPGDGPPARCTGLPPPRVRRPPTATLFLLAAVLLFPAAASHGEIPEAIEGDADLVYRHFRALEATGRWFDYQDDLENLEELDPAVVREVKRRLREDEAREQRAKEEFQRSLDTMTGDQWAGYTAAFFQSFLFEVDKPFEQAFQENLEGLGRRTGRTAQQLRDEMAAREQAEREAQLQAELQATGREVFAGYQGLANTVLTDTGFFGYERSTAAYPSALMVQSAMVGNLLQIRYQLNLLKNGDGVTPAGNFVNQPGTDVFNQVTGTLRNMGAATAAGTATDGAMGSLQTLLNLPGVVPTPEHLAGREGFINVLTGLSRNVADRYALYERLDNELRIKTVERANLLFPRDPAGIPAFAERREQLGAEIAALETRLAGFSREASQQQYLAALNQSPFLSAPVKVDGFEGPLWQYLAGPPSGWRPSGDISHRNPVRDQQALDQAISFLDGATMQALVEYGSIVDTETLVRTFGGPSFRAARDQLVAELSPLIPGMGAYMGELEGLFERHWADTEYSRLATDVGVGLVGLVIGGVVVLLPVTAPVLIPIEIALIVGDVGIQGGRLYTVYTDRTRAEAVAQSGAGDFTALTRYDDVLRAQSSTFVLTTALAPLGIGTAGMALDDAARLMQQGQRGSARAVDAAADAGGTGASGSRTTATTASGTGPPPAAAADTASTGTRAPVVAASGPAAPPAPAALPDATAFRAMSPEAQAALVETLPEALQIQLVGQLSTPDVIALQAARGWRAVVDGIRANPQQMRHMPVGNAWVPLTPESVARMTDQEILAALRNGSMDVAPQFREGFQAVKVTDEVLGLASPFDDLPPPGFFSRGIDTQDQVDALFRINVDALPVAERQTVILQRSDVLLRGMKPTFRVMDDATYRAVVESTVMRFQDKWRRPLSMDELRRVGWRDEWGRPPPPSLPAPLAPVQLGSPPGAAPGPAAGAGESGSTMATGSHATLVDGPAGAPVPPAGLAGWNALPQSPAPFLSMEQLRAGRAFFHDLPQNQGYQPSLLPSFVLNLDERPYLGSWALQPLLNPPPPTQGPILRGGRITAGDAMTSGGAIVHLQPGPWTWGVEPGKEWLWRNFVLRTFVIGPCVNDWNEDCGPGERIAVLGFTAADAAGVSGSLAVDPQVRGVEPNPFRWRQSLPNDPLLRSRGSWGQPHGDQWALDRIGLTAAAPAWPPRRGAGAPVVVAVIDTGLAWSHPDLGIDSLWINAGEKPGNDFDDDGNGYVDDVFGWNFVDSSPVPWDLDGHGTLVASLIAARTDNGQGIAGINPRVRLMPLKAVDNAGRSRASYLAEAIVYAVNNGARIINLSVGGNGLTQAERLAVAYAHARGVLVVAAAGNEGQSLDNYGPGGADHVLTVAATDPADRRLPVSNWGPQVDLAAPGLDILGLRAPATDLMQTADPAGYVPRTNFVGDGLYYRATGTSFAAPLVAGVASLLLAADPALSAEDLRRMLLHSAVDIEVPGPDQLSGYGRLDAAAALRADPAFYLEALIRDVRVDRSRGEPMLEVLGTAAASDFRTARLELGAGEAPATWQPAGGGLSAPVRDGVLGAVPVSRLAGGQAWTLRVVVEDTGGRRREARYLLRGD